MSKHLNVERWFELRDGRIFKMKRVSAANEQKFPRELRLMYREHGPAYLCKYLMQEENISLAAAWTKVKTMFN